MNISACIQARMNSQRLPGKVLSKIESKPMLQWQIERLRYSRLIDNIIVATTSSPKDDPIELLCKKLNINYFRGSESNVLNRVSETLKKYKVDIHVEGFGDSPLADPQIIDEFIGYFLKYQDRIDYVSSALESTYPAGMEVSVYNSSTLFEIEKNISPNDSFREHCGFNITRFAKLFNLISLKAPSYLNRPDIFLEVDTEKDLKLINEIIRHFNKKNYSHFSTKEIINFLNKNKSLIKLNQKEERRWKKVREINKELKFKNNI